MNISTFKLQTGLMLLPLCLLTLRAQGTKEMQELPPPPSREATAQVVDDYSKGKFFGAFHDDKGSSLEPSIVKTANDTPVLRIAYERLENGYVGIWSKVNQSYTKNRQDWSTAKELRLEVFSEQAVQLELVLKNGKDNVASMPFEVTGGTGKWETIVLPLADFLGVEGGISIITDFNLKVLSPGKGVFFLHDLRILREENAAEGSVTHPGARLAAVTAEDAFATLRANEPGPVSNRTLNVSAIRGGPEGDGSTDKPFASIQQAVDEALPGDTILVEAGTYVENAEPGERAVKFVRSGRPEAPIVLKAAEGPRPLLIGNGWSVIWMEGRKHIRIEGFQITSGVHPGKGFNTSAGISIRRSAFIEVVDNYLHDLGGGGVGTMHSDYILIEGNRIERTSFRNIYNTSAISLFEIRDYDDAPGFHNIIRNNICIRNENTGPTPLYGGRLTDGNGIIIDHHRGTGPILIENNLLVDNGGRGISFFKAGHALVRHNTSVWNGRTPDSSRPDFHANSSDDILFVNNLVIGRPGGVLKTGWQQGESVIFSHNVFAGFEKVDLAGLDGTNRIFENLEDLDMSLPDLDTLNHRSEISVSAFLPGSESPVVDAGDPDHTPAVDFTETSRPKGSAPDIGALERL